MLHPLRLVTVHPALIHFTLGALPIFVIAYGVAALYRSERWTLAGDIALAIGAGLTLFAAAFGLVAFLTVGWPGGLELWRWLHFGLGIAMTVGLAVFAGVRLLRRRPNVATGWTTFGVAAGLAAVTLLTGWVGGDVLVYHGGIGVAAAGQGALSPPTGPARTPRDLLDAMGETRAAWGSASAVTARMLVRAPTDADFAAVAADGRRLQKVASWITEHGAATLPKPTLPVLEEHMHRGGEQPEAAHEEHEPEATHEQAHGEHEAMHAHEHEREAVSGAPKTRADHLTEMASDFGAEAAELTQAAEKRDLRAIAERVGDLSGACADCHLELRWVKLR